MTSVADLLQRERDRRTRGERLLSTLSVLDEWSAIGSVTLEGAMALNLVVNLDADIEVVVREPDLGRAVTTWLRLRAHPQVLRGSVIERPEAPFGGTYFLLVADDENGHRWSIETWVFPEGRQEPRGADLVALLRPQLTDETRSTILRLKESLVADRDLPRIPSVRIYEAVLDYGIDSVDGLVHWVANHPQSDDSPWMPK